MGLGAAATTAAAGLSTLGGGTARAETSLPDDGRPDPHEPQARPDPRRAHGLTEPGAEVRRLFAGLEAGAALEDHWRVERVYGVRAGAIPVVLSAVRGGRFAVEIFRHDEAGSDPIGIARPLALHLVNRGDGAASTDELAGLGVQALARALERRLAHGAAAPSTLLTHAERRARHPAGVFHVPVG